MGGYETIVRQVEYINLSMGGIGIYGMSCANIKTSLKDLGMDEKEITYLLEKIVNVCIRTTYFIFCKRNNIWPNPDLLTW